MKKQILDIDLHENDNRTESFNIQNSSRCI